MCSGHFALHTVLRIIKLNLFPVRVRFRSGSAKLNFVVISPYFTIFKNVEHSLEPGETPSYSLSQQALNCVQRFKCRKIVLNDCGSVAVWMRLFF